MYDDGLDGYAKWLVAEVHPSLDANAPQEKQDTPLEGAQHVAQLLDELNLRFQSLLDSLRERLKHHAALHPEDIQAQVSLLYQFSQIR